MKGTWRVFRAELYRLLRSRATHLTALGLGLVPVLHVVAARSFESAQRLEAARSGRELLGLEEGRGWVPMIDAWRVGLALGALLLLIHGARAIAGDRERGVLRLASTRTASRWALAAGRVLLGPFLAVAVTAICGFTAWATASLWFEFGDLVEDGDVILEAAELRHELWVALGSALPALWGVHALGLLISALSRGGTLAVATSVALFLAFDLFKASLGLARYWCFATFSPSLLDESAMAEMVGMAHGYSDAGYTQALVRMGFLLPGPQAALLAIAAAVVLSRRRL